MSRLEEIKPQIEAIAETDPLDQVAVRVGGYALESFLLHDPNLLEPNMVLPIEYPQLARLQALYERFETNLESLFATRFLNNEVTLPEYRLYGRFQRLVQAEARLAQIKAGERLLFIGSGPFPVSPILMAQLTGAHVDCYDKSEQAAEQSLKVVEKLGMADRVKIHNVAGEHGPVSGYDYVAVALLAEPKHLILENICSNAGPGQKVVIRYSEGVRKVFYGGIDRTAIANDNSYEILDEHHAGVDDSISTLVGLVLPVDS